MKIHDDLKYFRTAEEKISFLLRKYEELEKDNLVISRELYESVYEVSLYKDYLKKAEVRYLEATTRKPMDMQEIRMQNYIAEQEELGLEGWDDDVG